MNKPVIGVISVSRPFDTNYFGKVYKSYVVEHYTDVLKKVGALPIVLTQVESDDVKLQLDMVDGILIVGGADVDPKFYDEEPSEKIGYTNYLDDIYHISVINEAVKRDLPYIGICRGYQILNVALGGSLYQDLPSDLNIENYHEQKDSKENPTHIIKTIEGTKLNKLIGESAFVNSFHHQAVKKPGKNLIVSARCEKDNIIEAVEHESCSFIIGVQWHPEALVLKNNQMLPLFTKFVHHATEKNKAKMHKIKV